MEASPDVQEMNHFKEVVAAFFNYQIDSMKEVIRTHKNFASLKQEYLDKLPEPFEQRINRLKESIVTNYFFLVHLVHPHRDLFDHEILPDGRLQLKKLEVPYKNVGKLRSTLRQIVRDWTAVGKPERDMCYTPVIQELQKSFPQSKGVSVLVPGCGLGRLPYELAKLGFKAQGNEFSYFMLLTSDYLLNKTTEANQFKIMPFIHDFSNVFRLQDVFREVKLPDECAAHELPEDSDLSMVAGEFLEVYSQQLGVWDSVVTCFFMDTANNIIEYVDTIYKALKPGGVWVNFGPLLYHYADLEDEVSIDLSWEEFRHVVVQFGFEIVMEDSKKSSYASEANVMLEIAYNCIFFKAIKPALV